MNHALTRRALLLGFGAACGGTALPQVANEELPSLSGARIRFADVEIARSLLGARDDWMDATGEFQRRAIMNSGSPVSLQAFQQWNGDAAQSWSAPERERWRRALEQLVPGFAMLRIPLPSELWLVSTNGQESANLPYTRGNFIALPQKQGRTWRNDAVLLAHELWHVAARQAPALASRLYSELGFEPMPRLFFPAAWADIRIANPDAPFNDHAMRLPIDGRSTLVTPVLVARRTDLRPGESFVNVMEARLLEVQPDPGQGASLAVLQDDGGPRWHPIRTGAYIERLGGNTSYVIHPEEVLADNIALLATGSESSNPDLLARLRRVLEQAIRLQR
jgi:hypothetical protein